MNNGWRQLMARLNYERLFLAANMLGLARRAFDDAVTHVRQQSSAPGCWCTKWPWTATGSRTSWFRARLPWPS